MGYTGTSFSRKTSLCCYCGKPGARTVSHKNKHGHEIKAHRRCIPKQQPLSVDEAVRDFDEGLTGPRVTSKTSITHHRTTRFGLNKETR